MWRGGAARAARAVLTREPQLGLSRAEMQTLMSSADVNDDGVVDYTEFVKLAYNALLHFARERAIVVGARTARGGGGGRAC